MTVLDLAAALDRDTVKMPDGTTYELRNPQEFGVVEDVRLRQLLKQVDAFRDAITEDATAEDAETAEKLLRDLATMLVVDLQAEIPDWAAVAIFEFWATRAGAAAPDEGDADPRSRRTTAASSRGSKRSTAASKKRGSTSPRGR